MSTAEHMNYIDNTVKVHWTTNQESNCEGPTPMHVYKQMNGLEIDNQRNSQLKTHIHMQFGNQLTIKEGLIKDSRPCRLSIDIQCSTHAHAGW